MKKVFTLAFVILSFAFTAIAQDNNVISVTGVYNRNDTNIKNIGGESRSYDENRDGLGGEVTWHYFPWKAPIGVGMTAGVLFHEKDESGQVFPCGSGCTVTTQGTSTVQKGYFQYEMPIQKRSGNFQPGIAPVVGVSLGNFGGMVVAPGGSFTPNGTKFYYGAKGWVDINVYKKKTFFRTGVQVANHFNSDLNQVDVQAFAGLAFKF